MVENWVALETKTPVCLQLNEAFTLYKKEKAENDKMLNETNDKLQKQLSELRSSHAKLTSQLEFSNKRCLQPHSSSSCSSQPGLCLPTRD